MMRIGVQTWGSEGDNRPLIALARRLDSSGHEVTLSMADLGLNDCSRLLEGSGVKLLERISLDSHDSELAELGRRSVNDPNPMKQFGFVMRHLFDPLLEDISGHSALLADSSDLVVGHFAIYPLAIAAEKRGVPHVSVTTTPAVIPAPSLPLPGVPWMGKLINGLLWRIGSGVLHRMGKGPINALRVREGLEPVRDVVHGSMLSKRLNLIEVSPSLFTRPPEWGAEHLLTGWFGSDLAEGKDVSPELSNFLESGPPPVYITAGSMMSFDPDPQHLARIVLKAVAASGCRAVLQIPERAIGSTLSRDDIHVTSSTDHFSVFPKCSAVVHHGGAGTSHTACFCGVPSVVMAYGVDQVFWGPQLKRLGVAPGMLLRSRLTCEDLSAAIVEASGSVARRSAARELSRSMSMEDGTGTAVGLVEDIFWKCEL